MNLLDQQLKMLKDIYSAEPNLTLDIYINNAKMALKNHLVSVYPVCHKIVGELFFKKACYDYIQLNYLREYDLTFYGKSFPEYLKNIILGLDLILSNKIRYLPDLAQWEWAIHQAQCGQNYDNVFKYPDILLKINLEEKEIIFPQSSALIYSDYPLEEIWQVHQNNQIQNNDFELKIVLGEYYWWIGLVDGELQIQKISQSEFEFLNKIKNEGISAGKSEKETELVSNLVESLREARLILV